MLQASYTLASRSRRPPMDYNTDALANSVATFSARKLANTFPVRAKKTRRYFNTIDLMFRVQFDRGKYKFVENLDQLRTLINWIG